MVWPADFVDFVKRERLFATFLTPSEFADGDPNKRWDAARNAALSEIFGFYGLTYWYTEQVTILGLGPIWQSENKDAKLKAADDLEAGEVMAFGLSEREHGADVYNTDMVLTPASEEDRANGILYRATGEKYYIGNGNVASMVSVFGRRGDVEGQDAYVFFAADSAPGTDAESQRQQGKVHCRHSAILPRDLFGVSQQRAVVEVRRGWSHAAQREVPPGRHRQPCFQPHVDGPLVGSRGVGDLTGEPAGTDAMASHSRRAAVRRFDAASSTSTPTRAGRRSPSRCCR